MNRPPPRLPPASGPDVRAIGARSLLAELGALPDDDSREQVVLDIDLAIAARRRWLRGALPHVAPAARPGGGDVVRWLSELGALGDMRARLDALEEQA